MIRLAIVGTAGRGSAADKLDWPLFMRMYSRAEKLVHELQRESSVLVQSGGAAWADHIAVYLHFWQVPIEYLTLYLPCALTDEGAFVNTSVGRVANFYHERFSQILRATLNPDSFADLARVAADARRDPKRVRIVVREGFKTRNLDVGACDVLLAFTFGEGDVPKDGGTRHTWDNSCALRKIHVSLGDLR